MDVRFILTGHGRSGTKWLARLLSYSDRSVTVHHEPLAQFDAQRYGRVYAETLDPSEFVAERMKKMERVWKRRERLAYAEVNSYLRYCIPALRDALPGVPIAAIVRDGRHAVRSLLARGCYQKPHYPPVKPPMEMEPFAACCWYWADTYRRLVREAVPLWRLEDLNARVEVYEGLCASLGVTPSALAWGLFAGKRLNVGVEDEEPPKWSREQGDVFAGLAGDVQERLGYEMPGGQG